VIDARPRLTRSHELRFLRELRVSRTASLRELRVRLSTCRDPRRRVDPSNDSSPSSSIEVVPFRFSHFIFFSLKETPGDFPMTKSTKMLIAAAAMTGLLAGATAVKAAALPSTTHSAKLTKTTKASFGLKAIGLDDTDKADKHDCKGKNDCKGKGGCKTDSHDCKGKNDCKGKGGCKSTDKL
jgi:hypothetical protein